MVEKTYGQKILSLYEKPPIPVAAQEVQKEFEKKYLSQLEDIIRKHTTYADKYYIQVILTKPRLDRNTVKSTFVVRKTEPPPYYDQTLFSYDNRKNELLFHWTIPDEQACLYMIENEAFLNADEQKLLPYVKSLVEGKNLIL